MPGTGKITQVIGSTFDAEFPEDQLPTIYNAIVVDSQTKGDIQGEDGTPGADKLGHHIHLTGEVHQHLGGGKVRAVALGSTDGLRRGMNAVDTGGPITVPVGKETLGRVFNLLGETIDQRGPVDIKQRLPIHRLPPSFEEQIPATEVFETGLKVVDLICPYAKGGKIGLFGGAGVGKT